MLYSKRFARNRKSILIKLNRGSVFFYFVFFWGKFLMVVRSACQMSQIKIKLLSLIIFEKQPQWAHDVIRSHRFVIRRRTSSTNLPKSGRNDELILTNLRRRSDVANWSKRMNKFRQIRDVATTSQIGPKDQ